MLHKKRHEHIAPFLQGFHLFLVYGSSFRRCLDGVVDSIADLILFLIRSLYQVNVGDKHSLLLIIDILMLDLQPAPGQCLKSD